MPDPQKKAWFHGSAGQAVNIRGVRFDGSNDYMTRGADLTGNADGKLGTISFWAKLFTDGVQQFVYRDPSNVHRIVFDGADKIEIVFSGGGTDRITLSSSGGGIDTGSGWVHIMASWDVGNNAGHLYIDDVSDESTEIISNSDIDYTRTNHRIASDVSAADLDAELAQVYLNFSEYVDLSSASNRRKFISASGKPVNLGSDGSLPTGTSPIIFFDLAPGDAVSTFASNKGTGGGFTLTGSLVEASTSPSD